jgi:hypothetical protein
MNSIFEDLGGRSVVDLGVVANESYVSDKFGKGCILLLKFLGLFWVCGRQLSCPVKPIIIILWVIRLTRIVLNAVGSFMTSW